MKIQKSLRTWLIVIVFFVFNLHFEKVMARDLGDFVKTCGYGALLGAVAGGLSLAFSDHPTANLNPIARGASYGLYAGIIVGIYLHEKQFQVPTTPPEIAFLSPRFIQNKNGGVSVDGIRGEFIAFEF